MTKINNPRKMRIWNSLVVFEHMALANQFIDRIDNICTEEDTHPSQLPDSVVGTLMLYNICQCFRAAYALLEQEGLLKEGSPKAVVTIQ